MALIACTECGHQISSLARFCPKCRNPKSNPVPEAPRTADFTFSGDDAPEKTVPPNTAYSSNSASCEELLQSEFKPSHDEMIVLEGKTFLIKGFLNISDCYAYSTSKRYVVCDASSANILFQISGNDFASVEDARHIFSRKIIIKTVSGETYQVKCDPHYTWLDALLDPQGSVNALRKQLGKLAAESAGNLDWFYEVDGMPVGPVQEQNIIEFIQSNHTILRNTKVWNKSLSEWKRAEDTILTIFFRESPASGIDPTGSTKAARRAGLRFWPRILKYF